MSLGARITRLPRAFEPEHGTEARTAAAWAEGPLADLIAGSGGSSPYLRMLVTRESAWLETVADDPEAGLDRLLAALPAEPDPHLPTALREAKRRVALLVALCDLGGVWPLDTVTAALTRFADLALSLALRAAIAPLLKRGKLPGLDEGALESAGGMAVLAMGKMGAGELNYSSDIDLICLFDETRFERRDHAVARSGFLRATRAMTAMLSDQTGEGYVFRTDLRLRPDPAVTPVAMAMEAAEIYYEGLGRTWERAAYIKARAAAGDVAAGRAFLDRLRPFVWRKHLDFAAIEDAHAIRLRIRDAKHLPRRITLPGHDMKLGRGGIREIEFFTQTRQLIAGGRDPELRVRKTVTGLAMLAQKGWVPRDISDRLSAHYAAHRMVEHRVQMIRDAQTHALPGTEAGFERLACLMATDAESLRRDLAHRLEEVHGLTEGFFAPDGAPPAPAPAPDALLESTIPANWPRYPALRSVRAQAIFERLRPVILGKLATTARPEEALAAFDQFLSGLPAGVQLFSLFEANPTLVDLLVDITGTSPDLARYLARNASVFDAVIGGDFFAPWPGQEALRSDLSAALSAETDYERRLDLARRWGKEWHFRIGVHLLRGLTSADEAGRAYGDLASATLAALWPAVGAAFAEKHGDPPGRGAVVVAMGSLGAGRLHARSDLDLIVIYDAAGQESSDGRRPLPARSYYARLTQALVTALTAPMAEGRLYEVDMRLRPSGNQGPVATSWAAFQTYQREEAWLWEHLALTRARVVAGPGDLERDVESFRSELLRRPRDADAVLGEVSQMRARIEAAKGEGAPWDAKLGRGRLQEIELLSQALTLVAGEPAREPLAGFALSQRLEPGDRAALAEAHALFWSLQLGARLVSDRPLEPDTLGEGGRRFLTRLTGMSDMAALRRELQARAGRAGDSIDAMLGTRPRDGGMGNAQG